MRSRHSVALSLFVLLLSTLAFSQMRWVVAQPVINMYSGPSVDTDVISQGIYGVTVEQTEPNPAPKTKVPDGWTYIKTADNYPGWVQRNGLLPLDVKEDYAGKEKRVVTVSNRSAN